MEKYIFFLLLIFNTISCSHKDVNPWEHVKTPLSGTSQAIGGHSSGCLEGAKTLYPSSKSYQVMRLSRGRFFAHQKMIDFLNLMATKAKEFGFERIMIGDLAQKRGGPISYDHRSHQTGLDADIWYIAPDEAKLKNLDLLSRENLTAKKLVLAGDEKLDLKLWQPGHEQLLQWVSNQIQVERVFVNPAIKSALCLKRKKQDRKWLSKIRPWWGHDDHFHIRLKCPADNPYCQAQKAVPVGDGCDVTLDWWFSDEAKQLDLEQKQLAINAMLYPPEIPVLPERCLELLEKEI